MEVFSIVLSSRILRECMQRTQALQAFWVCTLGDDLVDLPELIIMGFSGIGAPG